VGSSPIVVGYVIILLFFPFTAFFGFLHRRLSVCCLCERDCLRQLDLMNMLASSQQSIFLVVVGWQIESSA
jgi:hypothetical protein